MSAVDRLDLLKQHGRADGELHLAIAFTDGLEGEAAKRSRHWQSRPIRLAGADHGSRILTRGLKRNPVISLAASGLIGIDVDGVEGADQLRMLGLTLPRTVSVRSGRPDGGVHLWYLPSDHALIDA